jgi:hypothetical protein
MPTEAKGQTIGNQLFTDTNLSPRLDQRQRLPTSAGVATSGANRVFETRAEFNFIRFIRRLRWQDSELA